MLYIDIKFANLLGPFLRNFKRKGDTLWNFSCPVCGDSSKNKLKARGYLFKVKTSIFVKCHNCGYSDNINNFIKLINPTLHQEYVYDLYKNKGTRVNQLDDSVLEQFKNTRSVASSPLINLKSIDLLNSDHPAVKYCAKRKIPEQYYKILFYAPKFIKYYNSKTTDAPLTVKEHPRLIIPFYDSSKSCFALQARSFGKEIPKYYTMKFDKTKEKIYGMDRVNTSKRIYIVEGPIDSLFINNAIAVSGSSFNGPTIESLKFNATIIYDNEPRSPTIIKLLEKSIDKGFNVCIWPDNLKYKDVNDMILSGITQTELTEIINSNTFSGLTAKVHLQHWRKCV